MSELCAVPYSTVNANARNSMLEGPRKSMTLAQRVQLNNSMKAITPLKSAMKKVQVAIPEWVPLLSLFVTMF